jgi:hypothetical protein
MERIETKYAEEIKKLGLTCYSATPQEDALVFDWWNSLVATKELPKIFAESCYSLSKFYHIFQRPNALFYTKDSTGIRLAMWAEPFFSSACLGLWISPRARHSKSSFRAMQIIYNILFSIFPSLLGITKQENLLTEHEKLGYTVIGKVPSLMDTQTAWILQLTRESFKNSKLYLGGE